MRKNWKITYFKPDRQGVFPASDSVSFATDLMTDKECGVILYGRKGEEWRYPFSKEGKIGNLYGLRIEGEGINNYTYNFFDGGQVVTDPYAREIHGLEKWGGSSEKRKTVCGLSCCQDFDWQQDGPPMVPLSESVIYGLNVRAFTMHKSSGVKHKGTFEGVIEKIPYLKELGITAVELMPCYEYDECMFPEEAQSRYPALEAVQLISPCPKEPEGKLRLNCWGYQKGFYFVPKAAYCAGKSPIISFKTLVRELHKNGMEVIMQFYFPPDVRQLYMLDVLKYWVREYHIDGVRMGGFHIPYRLLAEEPALKNTKIWCSYLPREELPETSPGAFKNFLSDNGGYRYDMRRFLKGDEGMLNQVLFYQRHNPKEHGVVNYLADYDGFSLYDCVCYEKKHNQANGEDNRDGADMNFTWNCGVEGDTRKKPIQALRLRQVKNALSFIFLSQGIPFLFSGDEFGNSRAGNNNCYCQDNETGWVKWKNNHFSRELLSYTRFLARLRKEHPILHMEEELQAMDLKGCGYPDISYHGVEAWRADLSYYSRMMGIALCGRYAPSGEDDSLYIAFNMHWEPHKMALPKPEKGKEWVKLSDSSLPVTDPSSTAGLHRDCPGRDFVITVAGRSVAIYKTREKQNLQCCKTNGPEAKFSNNS